MEFNGIKSRYNIGDKVKIKKTDECGTITNIGILGGKLSTWVFLYEVRDNNNKIISNCIEENIELI